MQPAARSPAFVVSLSGPTGISFDLVEHGGQRIFSIGCSRGSSRISVGALNPSVDTSEVVVHLADVDSTLNRVDREVSGIVAEGALSEVWIDAVAQADTVAVSYAGQTFGPLELPSNIRDLYVGGCRDVLTHPEQFL